MEAPAAGGGTPTDPALTVVICTYNRPDHLEKVLRSLSAQKGSPRHTQVLVMDDATPGDENSSVVGRARPSFPGTVRLDYFRAPGRSGLTKLRNMSLGEARGRIVMFLDDDVVLEEGYVEQIMRTFESKADALGVQGYWKQQVESPLVVAVKVALSMASKDNAACVVLPSMENVYPRAAPRLEECQWLQGNNMSYRREVFDEFRFNTALKRPPSAEDAEFSFRVFCAHRGSLYLNPDARLAHEVTPNQRPNWGVRTRRESVYRTYTFFRFRRVPKSGVRLAPFLRNRIGWMVLHVLAMVSGRGVLSRREHAKALFAMSVSYAYTLRHLGDILRGDLEFFSYG